MYVCVCVCFGSFWAFYKTFIPADNVSCLVGTRSHLISFTSSDWWLLLPFLSFSGREYREGRWDLQALCWSCCTSRCPEVWRWSLREAQVFNSMHPPMRFLHTHPLCSRCLRTIFPRRPIWTDLACRRLFLFVVVTKGRSWIPLLMRLLCTELLCTNLT